MKRIVLTVIVVLIALHFFATSLLPAKLQSRLEKALTEKTNWTVAIAKKPDVRLFPSPRVSFPAIVLKSPDGEASVQIDGTEADFDLLPFLFAKIRAKTVRINGIEGKNIPFGNVDFNIPELTLTFNKDAVALSGKTVLFKRELSLSGTTDRTFSSYDIKLAGDGTNAEITAAPDQPAVLRVSMKRFPKRVRSPFTLTAIIDSPFSPAISVPSFSFDLGTAMKAEGQITSVKPLSYSVKAAGVIPVRKNENGSYAFSATGNQNVLNISSLSFRSDTTEVENAEISLAKGSAPALRIKADAEKLALDDIPLLIGLARTFMSADGQTDFSPLSDEPFDVATLKAFTADADIRARQTFSSTKRPFGPTVFQGRIADGKLSDFRFDAADCLSVRANWAVSDTGVVSVALTATAKNAPADLTDPSGRFTGGTVNGTVLLKAEGTSPKAMAGNMNGKILIVGKKMTDAAQAVQNDQPLPSFLTKNLSMLQIPKEIFCLVVNTPIENGILTSDNRIAAETDIFNAQISGQGSFASNDSDLLLSVFSKKETLADAMLSKVFIKGNLFDPVIRLDAQNAFGRLLNYGLGFLQRRNQDVPVAPPPEVPTNVCREALRK